MFFPDILESTTADTCHRILTFPKSVQMLTIWAVLWLLHGLRLEVWCGFMIWHGPICRCFSLLRSDLEDTSFQEWVRDSFDVFCLSLQEHLSFWRFKTKLFYGTVWRDFTEILTTSPTVQQYQWWNPVTLAWIVYLDMWWLDLLSWPLWVFQKAFRSLYSERALCGCQL